jgi:hypothetical protein
MAGTGGVSKNGYGSSVCGGIRSAVNAVVKASTACGGIISAAIQQSDSSTACGSVNSRTLQAPWILETGVWNDFGRWRDTATWNDGD